MNDLRTAAQQALDDLKDLHANHNITYAGTISRLEAALAQEQAEQAWVCPDSAEHRYAKPGHCEDCRKTLVQEQGCNHCNHPLYAATKCRVCGRVTEQAEPTYKTYPIRMKFEWVGDRWLFDGNPIESGEWCVTLGDGGWMIYPKVEQAEPAEPAEPVKPVAWVDERAISWLASRRNKASAHITTGLSAAKTIERTVPLYTAPPQRKED